MKKEYNEQFRKKFLVGLTLNTTAKEFDKFLEEYAYYIEQVYFSMPLGDKFHSRIVVQKNFSKKENVELFWELLEISKKHGVKLDMVLNTVDLTSEDVDSAFKALADHNITLDVVTNIDEYYDYLTPHLNGQKIICSYNNAIRSIADIEKLKHTYDSYVFGNSLMRNLKVHKYVCETLKSKVCLLINNGCSFNCAWCGHSTTTCQETYQRNRKKHSVEYLYAHQSMFPEELRNNTIRMEYIDTIKISNRSSGLRYLKNCLDSYINNELKRYIIFNRKNFALWCKLAWFTPHYLFISFKKIMEEKEKIYKEVRAQWEEIQKAP